MDIYCPHCGEPWDNDELHDVPGYSYQEAARSFRIVGCPLFGGKCNAESPDHAKAAHAAALYDVLGDDMDGAASEFDY